MDSSSDKTPAIVLTTVTLNDRTLLVHLYTEARGRITCRVPLVSRGRRAGQLRQMMTPMTVLDLVLGGRPADRIRPIAEAHIVQSPYELTLSQPGKGAQCLYMAELLAHTVREEEPSPRLWQYITASLDVLQHCTEGWANHHLVFTCGIIAHLGFSIDPDDYAPGSCFDLREGTFTQQPIPHPYYLNPESALWFSRLLQTQYDTMHQLSLNHLQRAALLDMLLAFLAQQFPEMGQLRSIDVLKALWA